MHTRAHTEPHEDPHLEEEWEEVDREAEESREDPDSMSHELGFDSKEVESSVADIAASFDSSHLDSVSCAEVVNPDEDFANPDAPREPLDALRQKVSDLLTAETPASRQVTRARFLAENFGYASADHTNAGSNADSILTLLSEQLFKGELDKSVPQGVADSVKAMAKAWTDNLTKLWPRMANTYEFDTSVRLVDHMAMMGLVAELSRPSADQDEGFLWKSPREPIDLAVALVGDDLGPERVLNIGEIYKSVSELRHNNKPLPTAIEAEVLRLGFGLLASEPGNSARTLVQEQHSITAGLSEIAKLGKAAHKQFAGAGKVFAPSEEVLAAAARKRQRKAAEAARSDLGEFYDQQLQEYRHQIGSSDNGKARLKAFDQVLAEASLKDDLSRWSSARRKAANGDPTPEVVDAAKKVYNELARIREGIKKLIPKPIKLAARVALEIDFVQNVFNVVAYEYTREVDAIAGYDPVDSGKPLDGVRAILENQCTLISERKPMKIRTFTKEVAKQVEKFPDKASLTSTLDCWHGSVLNDKPSIGDATSAVLDAFATVRNTIREKPMSERYDVEGRLDKCITLMIRELRARDAINNSSSADPSWAQLISQLKNSYTKLEAPSDLGTYWSNEKKSLLKNLDRQNWPDFSGDFSDKLAKWHKEAERQPAPDLQRLSDLSWDIWRTNRDYRSKVNIKLKNKEMLETRAQFTRLLDTISSAMAARLAVF